MKNEVIKKADEVKLAQDQWQVDSYMVRGGYQRTQYLETSEPIFLNSGFVYETAEQAAASFRGETDNYIYSRFSNPTISIFEQKLARLEGADGCIATSTGMAAVFAALACSLKAGDRIVVARQLFYSCYYIVKEILPRFGIETVIIDGGDLSAWQQALSKKTELVFFESPTNPMLDIMDIRKICDLAHQVGAKVVLDNVLATPCFQRPLTMGVDIVTYSATKHIDGQGRVLGGAVLGSNQFIEDHLRPFMRHTGPGLSPFNAWILEKGLETLFLRVNAMSAATQKIAEFLEQHSSVARVRYPGLRSHEGHELAKTQMTGFGTIITITLKNDTQASAFSFLNSLSMIDISNNFGDAKSLATHPATTTHSKLSDEERISQAITGGTIRISIGLESVDDLVKDLEIALNNS